MLLAGCTAGRAGGGTSGAVRPSPAQTVIAKSVLAAAAVGAPPALPPLPADCIPKNGIQVQLGVYATFSGATLAVTTPDGPEAAATVSGSFCGIGTVVNPPAHSCPPGTPAAVQLHVPSDGQVFDLPGVEITMVPGLTPEVTHTQIVPSAITAVVCALAASGPLKVGLTATLSASASLFGATCIIGPLSVPLTGTIYGPLSGFTFTFTAGKFAIPAASPTATCPSNVTTALNQLFSFPLAAGNYLGPLSGTGLVYQLPG
jgi:hypothetical protein